MPRHRQRQTDIKIFHQKCQIELNQFNQKLMNQVNNSLNTKEKCKP